MCLRCNAHVSLADVDVTCEVCDGRRFKPEVLEVRLRGRNVDELLSTTVDAARPWPAEPSRPPNWIG